MTVKKWILGLLLFFFALDYLYLSAVTTNLKSITSQLPTNYERTTTLNFLSKYEEEKNEPNYSPLITNKKQEDYDFTGTRKVIHEKELLGKNNVKKKDNNNNNNNEIKKVDKENGLKQKRTSSSSQRSQGLSENQKFQKQFKKVFGTPPLGAFVPDSVRELYQQDQISIFPPKNFTHPAKMQCSYKNSRSFSNNVITEKTSLISCNWMILIMSEQKSIKRRQKIRETWLQTTIDKYSDVCFKFVIGQPSPSRKMINQLLKENRDFGDILFLNHKEEYLSLTEKSVHTFLRVYDEFKERYNVTYILKTDDDSYVRLRDLRTWIQEQISNDQLSPRDTCIYAGDIVEQMEPTRISWSKFSIWPEEWPYKFFRPFARGAGYVLSIKCIEYMWNECIVQNNGLIYFRLEDVTMGTMIDHFLQNELEIQETNGKENTKKNSILPVKRISSQRIQWRPICEVDTIICHHLKLKQYDKVHRKYKIVDELFTL